MSRYSYLGVPLAGGTLRYRQGSGQVERLDADGKPVEALEGSIWRVLPGLLEEAPRPHCEGLEPALPQDVLLGGYVGFMGYEAQADLDGTAFHAAGW